MTQPISMDMSLGFQIGLVGAGAFLLWGMCMGVWKFIHVRRPPDHQAPIYVDIVHRASLMYAFACIVLAWLAQFSAWPDGVDAAAVIANLVFFVSAVASYVVHALRGTEGTQFAERNIITTWGTWMLIAAEIGGTGLLLTGVLVTLF